MTNTSGENQDGGLRIPQPGEEETSGYQHDIGEDDMQTRLLVVGTTRLTSPTNSMVSLQGGGGSNSADNEMSSISTSTSTSHQQGRYGGGSYFYSSAGSSAVTPGLLNFSHAEMEEENAMDRDSKRRLLIQVYQTCEPFPYNRETLTSIGKTVRRVIVRKVKFIENEHTSGMTKEMIENTRKFPSFWQPDLTCTNTIQSDLFEEREELRNATLKVKAIAWMGMRTKVMSSIRQHRSAVCTSIQSEMLDGMLLFLTCASTL